jgi:hypothetical protein
MPGLNILAGCVQEHAAGSTTPVKAPPRAAKTTNKDAKSVGCRTNTRRPLKSKYNLQVDCVLAGQKHRKYNLESSDVLAECSSVMCDEDHPIIPDTTHVLELSLHFIRPEIP